jgi:hypothetical protein
LNAPRGHAELDGELVAEGEVGMLVSVEDIFQNLELVGGSSFSFLLVLHETIFHIFHNGYY